MEFYIFFFLLRVPLSNHVASLLPRRGWTTCGVLRIVYSLPRSLFFLAVLFLEHGTWRKADRTGADIWRELVSFDSARLFGLPEGVCVVCVDQCIVLVWEPYGGE